MCQNENVTSFLQRVIYFQSIEQSHSYTLNESHLPSSNSHTFLLINLAIKWKVIFSHVYNTQT